MPKRVNQLDLVATDLAIWIDGMVDEITFAMLGGASAPFAARVTEEQKVEYYTAQLFNADGSPNEAGRAAQLARVGPLGFRQIFTAVLKAHPELKQPAPPAGLETPPVGVTEAPMLPPGPGVALPPGLGPPPPPGMPMGMPPPMA